MCLITLELKHGDFITQGDNQKRAPQPSLSIPDIVKGRPPRQKYRHCDRLEMVPLLAAHDHTYSRSTIRHRCWAPRATPLMLYPTGKRNSA
ncbi:hypothetical protein AVEN_155708-1 [Araneus ventricosus]|uniref:Uncharacterized protein n=1 Tax=Araneus ventricosus TaxID=182803 RepID=A0A4Y2HXN8_ARAVE|nr:hypothetical protein AVEN_155708-1 [Araneus ventricosus]